MKKTQNNHDIAEFASELDWLAFCYVAGELTAEQTVQFEQRIADDLEAQIAVADAVALTSSTYASIETIQKAKVSLDRGQRGQRGRSSEADRSSAWRWVAVAAAGVVAIVSAWQLLPNSVPKHDVAVTSSDLDEQVTNSAIEINEVDLWGRTVEMYQSANLHGDEFEIWSPNGADESFAGVSGEEYASGDDDSGDIADALLVDSDLTSIFASAFSSFDPSNGGM